MTSRNTGSSVPQRVGSISRRRALELLLGLGLLTTAACTKSPGNGDAPGLALPNQVPGGAVGTSSAADDVAAVCDVLCPTERDASGAVTGPGATEIDVDGVLGIQDFFALASAQGLIPALADADVARFSVAADVFRTLANTELGLLAARHKPLAAFRDLPRDVQETVVAEAFADDLQKPLFTVLRAATMLAFLGGVTNDLGLQYVGFPKFENFADGLAVSGYPRTMSGRLIDATKEDLGALAAKGDLDDYTYNREPTPTDGDPLSLVLDDAGDLL